MNDDELIHYGKVGMKWGKTTRKSSRSSSKISSAKKLIAKLGNKKLKKDNKKLKEDNKKLKTVNQKLKLQPKTKPIDNQEGHSRISDAELKSRINRIEMEQKYAKLTAKPTNQAKKMVAEILQNAFKTTAQAYVTKMMGNSLAKLTADKLNPTSDSQPGPTPNPFRSPNSSSSNTTSESSNPSDRSPNSNYVYPNFRLLN